MWKIVVIVLSVVTGEPVHAPFVHKDTFSSQLECGEAANSMTMQLMIEKLQRKLAQRNKKIYLFATCNQIPGWEI